MIFKELGISILINFAFMIVTYGIRAPGGVFIPSMVIGATFGRLVGVTYEILQSTQYLPGAFRGVTVIPGVYALIGAASVVSGVTRISISLSVIMFEITGALNLVLPLMLSVIIAKIIGDVLEKESLYDWIITERGYPFINHKKTFVAASASAMDIMKINTPTLRINSCYSYDEMRIILNQQGLYILKLEVIYPTFDGGFPILSSDGVLVAYIRQSDVIRAFENVNQDELVSFSGDSAMPGVVSFVKWVDDSPLTVFATASADMIVELFVKLGVHTVHVVSKGIFIGIIHKKDIIAFLKKRHI